MKEFYDKYKLEIRNVFLAVVALFAAIYGGYQAGQESPSPAAVEQAVLARSTVTPAPSFTPRATRITPGVATLTPTPVVVITATPTVTLTPGGATATPVPTLVTTASPTPTSIVVGHDVTKWHIPGFAGHHHGQDPLGAHPAIVQWLTTHPWGSLFSSVGTLWGSSPVENLFPWPLGKHEGFVFLSESDTHCDNFDPGGKFPTGNCIKAYLFQPHTLGNAAEFFALKHSDKGVYLVCDPNDPNNMAKCGIVATGGVTNYGERHNAYKKDICLIPGIPVYGPGDTIEQPPYVAVNGSPRMFVFWSSLINFSMEKYFTPIPNRLFQSAWNQRPFSVTAANTQGDPNKCADLSAQINHTNLENRNNTFQVFTLLLMIDQYPRPFEGYTDLDGNESKTCAAPSMVCVPLFIGATVPMGAATLNRPVSHGDPEAAPIQVYGLNATLLPPGSLLPQE